MSSPAQKTLSTPKKFQPLHSLSMKKKPHHHLLLPLFLVALLLTLTSVVDSQSADGGDAAVMQDLKKALTFPNKKLDWSDPNVCKWESIQCEQGRITRIQVKDLGVTGTLPTNLNNLTALKDLELQGNHISGPLPTLTGMTALQNILINANNFSTVPSDFFSGLTSLQAVGMDKIPFQPWTIPQSLKDVSNLQNFSANSANIMGNIPDFFNANNFSGLINLHLAFNSLEGGLPRNFSGLSVASLWLNGQKLNGTIQVIQNMTNLKEVWLHSNAFTGPLPDFSGLTDLEDLSLRDNQFTGPIPESLKKLASLKKVNLTNNMFQGPTPVFGDSVAVDMDNKTNSFCFDDPGVECDPRVNTLLSILKPLGYPTTFAQNWKGNDPCASWVGILCARNNISVVDFANKNLTGTISPDFVNLTTLIRIDLSNNHLFGPIPKGLTSMPALRQLFLNDNQLSGDVPPDNGKELRLQGNPDLGGPEKFPSPPGGSAGGSDGSSPGANPGKGGKNHGNGKKNSARIIVGVIVAVVLVLLLLGVLGFCFYKRKKKFSRVQSPNAMVVHPRHSGSDPEMVKITIAGSNYNVGSGSEAQSHTSNGGNNIQMVETNNMVISIQVLRNVTNNFSEDNVLGRGGFGTVYKGELHDGTQIAVKRMESGVLSEKGKTEFESEIAVLTKVRHRHLVALVGYCLDGNERLLVYEYMPQGTLSHHLFNWRDAGMKPLEWTRRVSIALDVARAVEYLHSLANQSFIHRDLKPSNILLGDDMRAKVADFGLVRLAPEGKGSIETRLAGTFGYLAPEYAVTGRVTTKVDVYSFGVILMELITGRRALQETEPEESMHLVTWFRRMHINKDTFHKAIDPNINLTEETLASVTIVAELAGHCCAREPYQRPDMGHAVNVLSSLVELWKPSDPDSEDIYGIDLDMTLPQALKKWQAFEGSSRMEGDTSSFLASVDNTQTSIPDRPSGFSSTFNSGR